MAHGVFRTVLAIMLGLPLVAIACSEARPKNVQPVRRHGHLAESSQSAKDGTTPVSKLVAGLWGL
jgi:hypothetical protein